MSDSVKLEGPLWVRKQLPETPAPPFHLPVSAAPWAALEERVAALEAKWRNCDLMLTHHAIALAKYHDAIAALIAWHESLLSVKIFESDEILLTALKDSLK